MIIIRLWGGVGNQLFQYSFGEYLRLNTNHEIYYDVSSFGNSDKLREFQILILNNSLPLKNVYFSKYRGVRNRFFRFLFSIKNKFITEDRFNQEELSDLNRTYYLQGYWQNIKYINGGDLYKPKNETPAEIEDLIRKINLSHNPVSMHIRRGDYFTSKHIDVYGVCDVDYFKKSLSLINEKIKEVTIFIFSDDINWVKNNIELSDNMMIIPNYEVNQFWYIYLMSLCHHNIISNSSFSWWGAFLNMNPEKIVISPSKWTLDSDKTLALSEWIKI